MGQSKQGYWDHRVCAWVGSVPEQVAPPLPAPVELLAQRPADEPLPATVGPA